MSRIGFALHALDADFKDATFTERARDISKSLNYKQPCVVQSMMLYKPPKAGLHKDSTFLLTQPNTLLGLWIALEDTSIGNGCLRIAVGSHRMNISNRRLVKFIDEDGRLKMKYRGDEPEFEQLHALPVKKGTLVLIHGDLVHKSGANLEDRSRTVYGFHIYDASRSEWSKDNWLQPTNKVPFLPLY